MKLWKVFNWDSVRTLPIILPMWFMPFYVEILDSPLRVVAVFGPPPPPLGKRAAKQARTRARRGL